MSRHDNDDDDDNNYDSNNNNHRISNMIMLIPMITVLNICNYIEAIKSMSILQKQTFSQCGG